MKCIIRYLISLVNIVKRVVEDKIVVIEKKVVDRMLPSRILEIDKNEKRKLLDKRDTMDYLYWFRCEYPKSDYVQNLRYKLLIMFPLCQVCNKKFSSQIVFSRPEKATAETLNDVQVVCRDCLPDKTPKTVIYPIDTF